MSGRSSILTFHLRRGSAPSYIGNHFDDWLMMKGWRSEFRYGSNHEFLISVELGHADYPHWALRLIHKAMYYTQWKFDWLCSGPLFTPSHVALARLFEGGELKALIEYRGTSQKPFYTIRRFPQGVRSKATGRFALEQAMAAAENTQTS